VYRLHGHIGAHGHSVQQRVAQPPNLEPGLVSQDLLHAQDFPLKLGHVIMQNLVWELGPPGVSGQVALRPVGYMELDPGGVPVRMQTNAKEKAKKWKIAIFSAVLAYGAIGVVGNSAL